MKNIEILESKKIIDYKFAINYMEEKLCAPDFIIPNYRSNRRRCCKGAAPTGLTL